LDSPDAARHDAFRGQVGAFERAVAGARALRRAGVSLQVNATLFAGNIRELDGLYGLARRLEATALHLFVLVPVGCGLTLGEREQLTPRQVEDVLACVCRMQARGEIEVRATCAPMYHRVARQWLAANPAAEGAERVMGLSRGVGCLAGTGVLFVSHAGDVLPCGYFPVWCGSVLRQPLGEIWRSSPVLGELRDRRLLAGKCGRCDFKDACGGCRARAFAATGEWTAEDPICGYSPPGPGARPARRA
jgi:radical SAM protein with 4Fe4S-binding SPASM domain